MKVKVYTLGYFPFVMGGNVWQPISCEVETENKKHDLGRGYKGYLITAPNGKTFVAECDSGAFVGPTLEQVREDIKTGDPEVMKKQVADALIESKKAKKIDPSEFWGRLKCL